MNENPNLNLPENENLTPKPEMAETPSCNSAAQPQPASAPAAPQPEATAQAAPSAQMPIGNLPASNGAPCQYTPAQTPYRFDATPKEDAGGKKHKVMSRVLICLAVIVALALLLWSLQLFAQYFRPADSQEEPPAGGATSDLPEIQIGQGSDVSGSSPDMGGMTVAEVAAKVRPSVVGVVGYQKEVPFAPASQGTGFVFTQTGYIMTNQHVVGGMDQVFVVLSDNSKYEAKVVGEDAYTDTAVLKIEAQGLQAVAFGNVQDMQVGEYVVAIGNPGGLEYAGSVTFGIISAIDRPVESPMGIKMKCIQTDAAINPGNSGGPLVNSAGQVVGITSSKIVSEGFEGMGFALSVSELTDIFNQLIQHGAVLDRIQLGVTLQQIDNITARYMKVPAGLYVTEIEKDSAIYKAGLRQGDIITQADGKRMELVSDLTGLLYAKKAGTGLRLEVYRGEPGGAGNYISLNFVTAKATRTTKAS